MNTRRPPAPLSLRLNPASLAALKRWAPAMAAAGVLTIVIFAGFSGSGASSANPGAVGGSLTVPANAGPGVVVETDPAKPKTQLTRTLKLGMAGDDVKAAQQRLKDFGFDPGPIDGQFGPGTIEAMWAFEGLVLKHTYPQQVGRLTNDIWQTMQDPIDFAPRRPDTAPGSTHMEIYLDLQAAIVFTSNKPTLITHISSGTGQTWCDIVKYDTDNKGQVLDPPVEKDVCGVSKTPGGVFKFYRRYQGNREGPLGGMWNPVYFNFGIAVHGAHNVPAAPASHGCIRIPMFIANYFPSLVKNGDLVYVWDGFKEPEDHTTIEMQPVFNYTNPNPTSTSSSSTTSTTLKPTATTAKQPPTTPPTTPKTTPVTPPPATTTQTTASPTTTTP